MCSGLFILIEVDCLYNMLTHKVLIRRYIGAFLCVVNCFVYIGTSDTKETQMDTSSPCSF